MFKKTRRAEELNFKLACRATRDMIAGKVWGRFGLPEKGRFWLPASLVRTWAAMGAKEHRVSGGRCLASGLIPELVPYVHEGRNGWLWTGAECPPDAPLDHGAWPPHLARRNRYTV